VLLHGWPQTWHEWRKLIPLLADRYRLVVPDLPGLGESSRPTAYDKKHIASDLREMCERLELGRFHLVGHDWGGPCAFALATEVPQSVRTLAILDVTIPGIGPARREIVIASPFPIGSITPADVDEYLRCYTQPGAMRAGFEYYRALPQDKADNQVLHDSGFRLPMPVLALGGARAEARGRGEEPLESLRAIASNVSGGAIAECGHFIAEEQPALLAARLLDFFGR